MLISKQTPLTSPRGHYEHDFGLPLRDWEAACFDNAEHFAVVELVWGDRGRHGHTRFDSLAEAIRHADGNPRACLYAVASSGRFAMLDRGKWGEWLQRWERDHG